MGVLDRPVMEVRIVFESGEQESRFWKISDAVPKPDIPSWAVDPRRSWPHPQDPIILSMLVPVGVEATAREWLAEL
ncbi:MAG TPA: hypothetical protein VFG23_08455 [Polyangia bacterium]|nr:hypothetical protein [Polyangia bacterium]